MKKFGYPVTILILVLASLICGYLAWRDTQRASVAIDWTTATEIETLGFNIYRAQHPDQGYVLINDNLIPASQEPLIGGVYSFKDTDVKPGKVYYYLLEYVSMNGQASHTGPVVVTVKADYWMNLGLSILFIGLAGLVIFNRRSFNLVSQLRDSKASQGQNL